MGKKISNYVMKCYFIIFTKLNIILGFIVPTYLHGNGQCGDYPCEYSLKLSRESTEVAASTCRNVYLLEYTNLVAAVTEIM